MKNAAGYRSDKEMQQQSEQREEINDVEKMLMVRELRILQKLNKFH